MPRSAPAAPIGPSRRALPGLDRSTVDVNETVLHEHGLKTTRCPLCDDADASVTRALRLPRVPAWIYLAAAAAYGFVYRAAVVASARPSSLADVLSSQNAHAVGFGPVAPVVYPVLYALGVGALCLLAFGLFRVEVALCVRCAGLDRVERWATAGHRTR